SRSAPLPHRCQASMTHVPTVDVLRASVGALSSTGDSACSRRLAEDAEWLATSLAWTLPREPEVLGLLALIRLHQARAAARFDGSGRIVPLPEQDRSRWDHAAIADAGRLIARAAALGRPGPYQLQAAIVACHAEAPGFADTDWAQIVVLYDMLLTLAPSPVTRLQRAIALRHLAGPAAALEEVSALADQLDRYPLLHATRAELLRALGAADEAREADRRALDLTANPAQRALLEERLGGV